MNRKKMWFFILSVGVGLSTTSCHQGDPQECFKETLMSTITDLNWKRVAKILDIKDTQMVGEPWDIDFPGVQTLLYHVDPDNLTSSLLEIHSLMFPDINIVISGETSFIRTVLLKVEGFDQLHKYTTDFRHHSKWLVLCSEDLILNLQRDLTFLENVVVIFTTKPKANALLQVMTLQHHPSGSVFTPVSLCEADVSMCYFPNVKYGYNNRRIRVITYPNMNFVIKNINNNTATYTGYAMDVLHYVAGQLNISFSLTEPVDGSWGIIQNIPWDGIVDNLRNNTIDLAAIDLTITKERADVIDYIYPPIYTDGIRLLYKTLTPSPLLIVARPLHWEVYLIIVGVTIVMIATFYFIEGFTSKLSTDPITIGGIDPITRAVFRQGTQYQPRSHAGRILISFWWMFLMIVTGIYSANQAASFSSSERIHPFTTYEEIAESDYYLLNEVPGIGTVKFMTFDLPLIANLREKLYHEDFGLIHSTSKEKMIRVKEDKFALLAYLSTAYPLMADDCELEVIKENLFFEHLAFAVPKKSTFKEDIERIMFSLRESGTLDILSRKWIKKRNSSTCLRERTVQGISTETIAGSFVILACGLGLCFIVLCCERLFHKYILAQMMNLKKIPGRLEF